MATRITRHEEFEAAHLLDNYKGGCGNLHGHSYKIEVTLEGPTNKEDWGFILDFGILKSIIKEVVPDHKFIADYDKARKENTPECDILSVLDRYGLEYVIYPFSPSAENMCKYFAECIQNRLDNNDDLTIKDAHIQVVEVKLWETTNSYATWQK